MVVFWARRWGLTEDLRLLPMSWHTDRLANVPLVLNADDEASGMTLREWR